LALERRPSSPPGGTECHRATQISHWRSGENPPHRAPRRLCTPRPGFRDHPKILDGASDLLLEIFEERGKHVRIALGIPDMPLNACIQLGVWAEVSD
jgi:YjgF/chorismate_mutase-like, putative endoribonuclease